MLELKKIEIGYSSPLIRIDNLQLKQGEVYSLVGKNGSGKSTFFKSILGSLPILAGEIEVENRKLSELKQLEKSKIISFVASKFDGVQHLTGLDYVLLGRSPYTNFLGSYSEKDYSLVKQIFAELNCSHLAKIDTLKMSDGERQIVSIAKALAQESKLILLDEPSAFLDYSNRKKVMLLLNKIAEERKVCIIQSTHDLDLCFEFQNNFLILEEKSKSMILKEKNSITKQELIDIAFSEELD
jgi:iron complex transport system ATP-binding protein